MAANRLAQMEAELLAADRRRPARRPARRAARARAFSVGYDVPGTVPPVQQPTGALCWAAGTTSMLSWKDNLTYAIDAAVKRAGPRFKQLFDTGVGLPPDRWPALAAALGMSGEQGHSWPANMIEQKLRAHGPLWFVSGANRPPNVVHMLIVTGVHGDGSGAGTTVLVIDPAHSARRTMTLDAFTQEVEAANPTRYASQAGMQVAHF